MIKFRNLTGIFVVYGMIFVSSAGAQSNVSDFERVKSYLNSKGKKVTGLFSCKWKNLCLLNSMKNL